MVIVINLIKALRGRGLQSINIDSVINITLLILISGKGNEYVGIGERFKRNVYSLNS